MSSKCRRSLSILVCLLAQVYVGQVFAQKAIIGVFPEERGISVRDPAKLPRAKLPLGEDPPTVRQETLEREARLISLDEAIRMALSDSTVVRVLAGVTATNSGRTVFDPAIANAGIDRAHALFDPSLTTAHDWDRNENGAFIGLDPLDPRRALFDGTRNDRYDMALGVTKPSSTGGTTSLNILADQVRRAPVLSPNQLLPESRSTVAFQARQPLLRGAGVDVNLVPVVLARIDTERSYFRLKDSLQSSVRGVIEAYWGLVAARTDRWAVQQQVEQAQFAFRLEAARERIGLANQADLAQSRLAYENFRANLIAARANVLDRESALRSILGLPPTGPEELVPTTYPSTTSFGFDWPALVDLAQTSRPDLIELKLILEADYQLLLESRNQTLPQLDAVGEYRWNGIEGELLTNGDIVDADASEFTGWRLGIDFSVPLGLRAARAELREQELIISRDRANLDQRLLEIVHELAANLRALDRRFAQYRAFQVTREAATDNLKVQIAAFRSGRQSFINVLEAIVSWGNAVTSEAGALTQYNTDLAILEELTGTILEAHGVYFYEERFRSAGPLRFVGHGRDYAGALRPEPNRDRYGASDEKSEDFFDLERPNILSRERVPGPGRPEVRPQIERLPPVPGQAP